MRRVAVLSKVSETICGFGREHATRTDTTLASRFFRVRTLHQSLRLKGNPFVFEEMLSWDLRCYTQFHCGADAANPNALSSIFTSP